MKGSRSRIAGWLWALIAVMAACRPGAAPAAPATPEPTVAVVAVPTVAVEPVEAHPTATVAAPLPVLTPRFVPVATPAAATPITFSTVVSAPTPPRVSATATRTATPIMIPVATPQGPAPGGVTEAATPGWQYRAGPELAGARSAVLVLALDRGGRVVNFGSGISISQDGLILTTAQAVRGAAQIVVRHPDSPAGAARLIQEDPALGLVVLRSEAASLPVARLAAGAPVRPGDPIAAVGFVSVAGGSRQVDGRLADARVWASDVSQPIELPFVASVTPGYSGAPLLNGAGEVIGIVTQAPPGGGYGTAAPIDRARDLIARARGAAPEPAVAVPQGGIPDPSGSAAEILGLVQQYYLDLGAGNYQSTYAAMSDAARRGQSLAAHVSQFRSLESIQAGQPVLASLSGDRAIVQIQTVTSTRSAGGLYRQHWEITWYVVREGGVWRRDAMDQRALSEPTPIPG